MTSAFPPHRYTYQDYVSLEEESSTRHEFLAEEIVAMAGETAEHAALAPPSHIARLIIWASNPDAYADHRSASALSASLRPWVQR